MADYSKQLDVLKSFVEVCVSSRNLVIKNCIIAHRYLRYSFCWSIQDIRKHPQRLNNPSLQFFKDFVHEIQQGKFSVPSPVVAATTADDDDEPPPLEHVNLPAAKKSSQTSTAKPQASASTDRSASKNDASTMQRKIEASRDLYAKFKGGSAAAVNEESREKAQEEKSLGVRAQNSGDLQGAFEHFHNALMLYPQSALFWAKRAACLAALGFAQYAIEDCNIAIEISPDSAASYKTRGKLRRDLFKKNGDEQLRKQAIADLEKCQQLDYDDDVQEMLKDIAIPSDKSASSKTDKGPEEIKGTKSGASSGSASKSNVPSWLTEELFQKVTHDPTLKDLLQKQKIYDAVTEIAANPQAAAKYQNDPEVLQAFLSFMKLTGQVKQ
jgi:suppressor of tumorigenicity protein 13